LSAGQRIRLRLPLETARRTLRQARFMERSMIHRTALTFVLIGLTVTSAAVHAQGRVVIAGGGVSRDNVDLYQAMLSGRSGDGPICVIPTASASLDGARSSMDWSVETFDLHGGPGTAVGVLLSVDNPERASDDDVVRQLRQCSGYYFTGGVQSRTVRILRPHGLPSPALEALLARFHFGAAVGGSSAGAAIMSDPMIAGGSTTTAIARGVRRGPVEADEDDDGSAGGVSITPGIGFFRDAIVDQHFLARGRIGRLIAAVLDMDEYDLGFGVDEDTGLVAGGGSAWTVGASGVVVLDARHAQRQGRSATGLALHLMSSGDRFDMSTRRLTPGSDKRELPRTGPAVSAPADIFARWEFLHLLERFARSPQDRLAIPVEGGELVLRKGTDFYAAAADGTGIEGTPAGFTLRGLLLDVVIP
jgi:cyanophycinase